MPGYQPIDDGKPDSRDYDKNPPTLEERIRWAREEGNACTDTLLMVARLDDLDRRVKALEGSK